MKDFYVYIHRRKTDKKVFYVGKGCGGRAWSRDRRNRHWLGVVAKHGYTVEVIESGYQAWYAYEREAELIAAYKELGYTLTNKTQGGDGVIGYVYTDEHRAKIAERSKAAWATKGYREKVTRSLVGISKRNWGSAEYREKTVAALRKSFASKERSAALSSANVVTWQDAEIRKRRISGMVAAKATPESKARMSEAQNKKWQVEGAKEKLREAKRETMRPIVCVETGTVFDAVKAAARWLSSIGFTSVSRQNIRAVCDTPSRSAYGYHWQSAGGG